MGVEYEIHDLKNQRRFDLGKGLNRVAAEFCDPAVVRQRGLPALETAFADAWIETTGDGDRDYGHEVARAVWSFCQEAGWNVVAFCDSDDDLEGWKRVESWPETDSRYAVGQRREDAKRCFGEGGPNVPLMPRPGSGR